MQNSRRHGYVLSHRTVNPCPESATARIEVVKALSRQWAIGVNEGGRLTHYTVTLMPATHVFANLTNGGAELVSEHDRIVDLPTLLSRPHVQIAAAHADRLHFQQHLIVIDRRERYFEQFDAV